jgi:hypothetical protein
VKVHLNVATAKKAERQVENKFGDAKHFYGDFVKLWRTKNTFKIVGPVL